ncbi:hypothetical protein LPB86_05215 [Pedobacter sp. MC2016-14]|uniref:hypothetical protein n=1 Tax=Pedobacter sp. MC2016-14 TaxID=2897327 RepID=UPI001E5AF9DD|nr:hypothetical protein [Pedobacter sp. MC2016-14]MCD0487617.1 hypothetical protein [Pedobacter sp. MC2016-14]
MIKNGRRIFQPPYQLCSFSWFIELNNTEGTFDFTLYEAFDKNGTDEFDLESVLHWNGKPVLFEKAIAAMLILLYHNSKYFGTDVMAN